MPHFEYRALENDLASYVTLTQAQSVSSWFRKSAAVKLKWWSEQGGDHYFQNKKSYLLSNDYQACTNTTGLIYQSYDQSTASGPWEIAYEGMGLDIVGIPEPPPRVEVCPSAKERARALLKSLLSPSEWADYEKHGRIWVVGGKSKRRYLLRNHSVARNVSCFNADGKPVELLCAHPDGVPIEDVLITQKLHLEHNEDGFREIANLTPIILGGESAIVFQCLAEAA